MTIKWNLQRPTLKNIYIYLYSCVVKYHVCGGFLPQFFTTSSVIYAPHTFPLSSLYSCENIFSVKHLLEECGDIAYLLPVSKAAEWNPPQKTHTHTQLSSAILATSNSVFPNQCSILLILLPSTVLFIS